MLPMWFLKYYIQFYPFKSTRQHIKLWPQINKANLICALSFEKNTFLIVFILIMCDKPALNKDNSLVIPYLFKVIPITLFICCRVLSIACILLCMLILYVPKSFNKLWIILFAANSSGKNSMVWYKSPVFEGSLSTNQCI